MSFLEIQALAAAIIKGAREIIDSEFPLILVVENDIGKVLGNALNVALHREKPVVCIDGIHAQGGDYIDIGEPLANGRVVPVVTKNFNFQYLKGGERLILKTTLFGHTYEFKSVREVMAKANEEKSGDKLQALLQSPQRSV